MKAQYLKIYEEISDKIRNGIYQPGQRLVTEPVMAKEFGVSVGTLRKAIDRLVLEKKVRREQGRGTFVQGSTEASRFYVPSVKNPEFVYGVCQTLDDQEQVNQVLLKDESDSRVMTLPSPLDIKPILSSLYNQCSIVQAPLPAFNEMSDFYRPLPEELFEDFPEAIRKLCRSGNGKYRFYPFLRNQTLCYINRRNAVTAGIKLPEDDWTLEDLVQLCSAFRKADPAITPFGIFPSGSLWFDLLLWCYGGDFFDARGDVWLPERPFINAMDFYRKILQSKNAVIVSKFPGINVREFLQKPCVQTTFFGPRGCMDAGDDVMQLHPLPCGVGCSVLFAFGIPCNAPMPDRALEFLKKLKDHRLADIRSAAPASEADALLWCRKQSVRRAELIMHYPEKHRFLSEMPHWYRWIRPALQIIDYASMEDFPVENIRQDVLNILRDAKKQETFETFWM